QGLGEPRGIRRLDGDRRTAVWLFHGPRPRGAGGGALRPLRADRGGTVHLFRRRPDRSQTHRRRLSRDEGERLERSTRKAPMSTALDIRDLHVTVGDAEIIKGLTLSLPAGQVHAIMGPNGAGKSTLAYALAGRDHYQITKGAVALDGEDILTLTPEQRAAKGL